VKELYDFFREAISADYDQSTFVKTHAVCLGRVHSTGLAIDGYPLTLSWVDDVEVLGRGALANSASPKYSNMRMIWVEAPDLPPDFVDHLRDPPAEKTMCHGMNSMPHLTCDHPISTVAPLGVRGVVMRASPEFERGRNRARARSARRRRRAGARRVGNDRAPNAQNTRPRCPSSTSERQFHIFGVKLKILHPCSCAALLRPPQALPLRSKQNLRRRHARTFRKSLRSEFIPRSRSPLGFDLSPLSFLLRPFCTPLTSSSCTLYLTPHLFNPQGSEA